MKSKLEVVPPQEIHAGHKHFNHKPLVLVVDDETIVADTLSIILRTAGYSTLTAYAPMRALEMVKSHRPDVLISDIAMPEMDGVAMSIAAVAIHPKCCVLLISGHATPSDLIAARNAGYNFKLLQKPVHPGVVLRNVAQLLRSGRTCNTSHRVSMDIPLSPELV